MKRLSIFILLSILLFSSSVFAQKTTDTLQTIPPIIVSGPNAISGCTVLTASPGSIVSSTSGSILAYCPNTNGAILFKSTGSYPVTETPSFLLSTGWSSIAIELDSFISANGHQCSPTFVNPYYPLAQPNALVGANISSGQSISFYQFPGNSSALPVGGYDYCLFYSNAPSTGLASFTISWTP